MTLSRALASAGKAFAVIGPLVALGACAGVPVTLPNTQPDPQAIAQRDAQLQAILRQQDRAARIQGIAKITQALCQKTTPWTCKLAIDKIQFLYDPDTWVTSPEIEQILGAYTVNRSGCTFGETSGYVCTKSPFDAVTVEELPPIVPAKKDGGEATAKPLPQTRSSLPASAVPLPVPRPSPAADAGTALAAANPAKGYAPDFNVPFTAANDEDLYGIRGSLDGLHKHYPGPAQRRAEIKTARTSLPAAKAARIQQAQAARPAPAAHANVGIAAAVPQPLSLAARNSVATPDIRLVAGANMQADDAAHIDELNRIVNEIAAAAPPRGKDAQQKGAKRDNAKPSAASRPPHEETVKAAAGARQGSQAPAAARGAATGSGNAGFRINPPIGAGFAAGTNGGIAAITPEQLSLAAHNTVTTPYIKLVAGANMQTDDAAHIDELNRIVNEIAANAPHGKDAKEKGAKQKGARHDNVKQSAAAHGKGVNPGDNKAANAFSFLKSFASDTPRHDTLLGAGWFSVLAAGAYMGAIASNTRAKAHQRIKNVDWTRAAKEITGNIILSAAVRFAITSGIVHIGASAFLATMPGALVVGMCAGAAISVFNTFRRNRGKAKEDRQSYWKAAGMGALFGIGGGLLGAGIGSSLAHFGFSHGWFHHSFASSGAAHPAAVPTHNVATHAAPAAPAHIAAHNSVVTHTAAVQTPAPAHVSHAAAQAPAVHAPVAATHAAPTAPAHIAAHSSAVTHTAAVQTPAPAHVSHAAAQAPAVHAPAAAAHPAAPSQIQAAPAVPVANIGGVELTDAQMHSLPEYLQKLALSGNAHDQLRFCKDASVWFANPHHLANVHVAKELMEAGQNIARTHHLTHSILTRMINRDLSSPYFRSLLDQVRRAAVKSINPATLIPI